MKEIMAICNYYIFDASDKELARFLRSLQDCEAALQPWADCVTEHILRCRKRSARCRRRARYIEQLRQRG